MKSIAFILAFLGVGLSNLNTFAQVEKTVKWTFSAEPTENGEVILHFKANIDRAWHMYGLDLPEGGPQSTVFTFTPDKGYKLVGKIAFKPAPTEEFDEVFKVKVKYFGGKVDFSQRIQPLGAKIVKGIIEYQTCKEGTCAFNDQDFSITIPETKVSVAIANATDTAVVDTALVEKVAEASMQTAEPEKEQKSMGAFILIAILTGFGALLTPCVFPMIPMTVSFFMNKQTTRFGGITNAIVFGLSIIFIYTLLGVLVSLPGVGGDITNQITSHWITNLIFGVLFLAFAASLFGVFEIVMPSWMASKTDSQAEKGGLIGAFFLGLTTVIVSLSCVGPFVGALLIESSGGVALRPIVGMFSFSAAFALPFIFLAAFPSLMKNLPKSGGWLNSVKVVMGFILLAFSLKFFSVIDDTYHWNLLTREVYLSLWIAIFSLLGLYFLGKIKFKFDSDLKHVGYGRLLLAIISFAFVVYMIPGLFGAPVKSISGFLPTLSENKSLAIIPSQNPAGTGELSTLIEEPKYADFLHLSNGLVGYFDYDQALAVAKRLNKPLFIDFIGHACSSCKEMEAKVISDPRILQRLRTDFVIVALYVDEKNELPEAEWYTSKVDGKLKKTIGQKNKDIQLGKFRLNGQPYYVIIDQNELPIVEPHAYDLSIDNFVQFLDSGKKAFDQKNKVSR